MDFMQHVVVITNEGISTMPLSSERWREVAQKAHDDLSRRLRWEQFGDEMPESKGGGNIDLWDIQRLLERALDTDLNE